jgi:hypothetical protein
MAKHEKQYFAAKEDASEVVEVLQRRMDAWYNDLTANGYLEKLKRSWAAYHGAFYDSEGGDHQISFTGEQGELIQLPVNHYKNIATHLHNMTTSNRPSVKTRATNTDYKSMTQTILADGLLDYYLREKKLEEYLRTAAEHAIVFGEGYIKLEWDATSGEVVDYNEDTKADIREGDVKFSNLSPFDVVRDSYREDNDHEWIICRTYKNRYDLIAQFPDLEEPLLAIDGKDKKILKLSKAFYDTTELVPVYEFYHNKTAAMPDGRYILFASEDAILYDSALPYRMLPVFRIAPSNIIGTPYGTTPMFDLLPLQENLNMLYSVVASNQNAFGVQNVLAPKGAGLITSQLSGGLNLVEYNPNLPKPEPMNLTHTPPEIFNMINMMKSDMETLSGINSVTRGSPEASLRTGTALALVQAQAVQFASGLQASYVRLIENVCTATIKMLQDFADVPRVAAIVGRANRAYMKSFNGQDLSKINRVIVEIANPISKTTAGRLEIATQLLQQKQIKNVDQFFTVLNTGRLDSMIEGDQAELLLIRAENERMLEGEAVQAMALDSHILHIVEHKALMADPDLRRDEGLVQLVGDHIKDHVDMLRTVDPDILTLIGQQPLQEPQMASPPEGEFQKMPGEENLATAEQLAAQMRELPVGPAQVANLPKMPTPPPPFEGMPTTPGGNVPE